MCRQFDVAPDSCWVVGDYIFDIEAGRRAGANTVLMLGDRQPPDYADLADHTIHSLDELIALVDPFDVSPTVPLVPEERPPALTVIAPVPSRPTMTVK